MESRFMYHFNKDGDAPRLESSTNQCLTVDRGIDSSRTAHFNVEGHQEKVIDMSRCYIKTIFRVVKENGDMLDATDYVYLKENFGTNLWAQASVRLNRTPLPPSNDYPYTALLINLLGSTPEHRTLIKQVQGTGGTHGQGSSKMSDLSEASKMFNKSLIAGSRWVTIYNQIYSDFMMSCSQYLPNKMSLGLTLTRGKDSFVLGTHGESTNKTYKIEVSSVKLFVNRKLLNSIGRSMLGDGLSGGGYLQYQRLHTVVNACGQGSLNFHAHDCFAGIAPRKAFVCLVSQASFYGSFQRDGSYLESAGVATVRFLLDGRDIMAEPYNVSFKYHPTKKTVITLDDIHQAQYLVEKGEVDADPQSPFILQEGSSNAVSAYDGLLRVMGTSNSPRFSTGIYYSDFIDGSTVYAVDLDHCEDLRAEHGSFDVDIEFATPLSETMMVVIIGEYPKTLAFDADRSIREM